VASHAQKYFARLDSPNEKAKRHSSIHDITSVSQNTQARGASAAGPAAAAKMAAAAVAQQQQQV
jgi:hypothetical protein